MANLIAFLAIVSCPIANLRGLGLNALCGGKPVIWRAISWLVVAPTRLGNGGRLCR